MIPRNLTTKTTGYRHDHRHHLPTHNLAHGLPHGAAVDDIRRVVTYVDKRKLLREGVDLFVIIVARLALNYTIPVAA